jgi:Protein of unknown function (DUF2809)
LRYFVAALLTIAVGLLVHRGVLPLSPVARDVFGDALWAMMMMWWMGVLLPAWRPERRAVVALAICVAVEWSQRWHAPWLDAVRATRMGHLVLGSGFDARDLVAYAAGVVVAMLIDLRWLSRGPSRSGT